MCIDEFQIFIQRVCLQYKATTSLLFRIIGFTSANNVFGNLSEGLIYIDFRSSTGFTMGGLIKNAEQIKRTKT